ncbi:MAG TPA: acyltransferase, partial [Coriobacteriia bacterium]|nr:acyltransferase [Coriobacteriia bacterium]
MSSSPFTSCRTRCPERAIFAALQEIALKWAVPFFFAASGYLHGRSRRAETGEWLRQRMVRLGIPYAFWTTLRLVDLSPITPWTLLKQYALAIPPSTLWFLWTLALATVLAWALLRAGVRPVTLAIGALVLALAQAGLTEWLPASGALAAALRANPTLALQSPLTWLWVYAGGIVIARLGTNRERMPDWAPWALLGAVALVPIGRYTLLGAAGVNWRGYHFTWGLHGLWQGVFGLAVLLVAERLPVRSA